MYVGPVVAAQQVLDPSPQTSCPRKEKGGWGHIHYNQVFRSLIPGSRYSFTFKMLRVRSFCFLVYQSNLFEGLIKLSLISYSGGKNFMRIPATGLVCRS